MGLSAEAVLQRVARYYRLRVADLVRSLPRPSEARQVGQGLQGIARRMGLSDGGVSRRVQAVAGRLTTDRRFRQRVDSALGVKVETWPFPFFPFGLQFVIPDVLKVPPISERGNVVEIANNSRPYSTLRNVQES